MQAIDIKISMSLRGQTFSWDSLESIIMKNAKATFLKTPSMISSTTWTDNHAFTPASPTASMVTIRMSLEKLARTVSTCSPVIEIKWFVSTLMKLVNKQVFEASLVGLTTQSPQKLLSMPCSSSLLCNLYLNSCVSSSLEQKVSHIHVLHLIVTDQKNVQENFKLLTF